MNTYKHDLEFILEKYPDYFNILFQCSIISEIIYEKDPQRALNSDDFKYFNHGINSMCVSQTVDETEENKNAGLEVKYMICDCSTTQKKRIIIGFRGTKTMEDFLVDLKLVGEINNCQGRFHSGIFRRSETISIRFFLQKLIEEDYQLVFTGHSLGAAVGALVATKILLERALNRQNIDDVLFIGFGCPLFACQNFKLFIERNYLNNFHFYVNEDDVVPRILALLSSVIHEEKAVQENSSYIENCKAFISLLSAPKFIDFTVATILAKIASMVPEFLKLVLKSAVPNYKPFGRYFQFITKPIVVGDCDYAHVINENWIELGDTDIVNFKDQKRDIENIIKGLQSHYMKNYFLKLKPFFDEFAKNLRTKSVKATIQIDSTLFIPEEKHWLKKASLKDLINPASYYTMVVVNESYCDLFLTIMCQNLDYLVSCSLGMDNDNIYAKKIDKNYELDAICYTFTCPNEKIIRNGELIKEFVQFDCNLTSHFNKVTFKIKINKNELEKGFSFREEQISNMQCDLLYICASCYIYSLQKLGQDLDGNFSVRCDQLKNLFEELDKIWDIDGKYTTYDAKLLENELNRYFFSTINDEKAIRSLSSMIFGDFNINFSSKFVKLKEASSYSKSTKDLFRALLPSVYHLNKLQSEILELRAFNASERITMGGTLLIPLLFVPGLNIAATIVCCLGLGSFLFASYNITSLMILSRKYY